MIKGYHLSGLHISASFSKAAGTRRGQDSLTFYIKIVGKIFKSMHSWVSVMMQIILSGHIGALDLERE